MCGELYQKQIERGVKMINEINKKFSEYMHEGRLNFVTFHPSLSYEEFVEGVRAKTDNGKVEYNVEDGVFKTMCINAYFELIKHNNPSEPITIDESNYSAKRQYVLDFIKNPNEMAYKDDGKMPFVLIIDEINRGNIPKIFGELITLLEPDKRLGMPNQIVLTLPYSKDQFGIPPNLHIIGTMNTADRSLALMDIALRRRFAFVEFGPGDKLEGEWKNWWDDPTGCKDEYIKLTIQAIQNLNKKILGQNGSTAKVTHGKDKLIGHSFAMKHGNHMSDDECAKLWRYEIFPLLEEYYNGNYDKIEELLGKTVFQIIYKNNSIKNLSKGNVKEVLSKLLNDKE